MTIAAQGRRIIAVVLAAGKGTRMRSQRPKVLHRVAGRPMLEWVLETARQSGCEKILVIIGHGSEEVRKALDAPDVVWVEQREQLGTGHALAQVAGHVEGDALLLVLSGDVPAVRVETLRALVRKTEGGWGALAVAELDEPGSLGRVAVHRDGTLAGIVEAADAGADELALKTINAGLYALPAPGIFTHLEALQPDNARGELYLTDAVVAAAGQEPVHVLRLDDPREALGVNDRVDLARVHRVLVDRAIAAAQAGGATIYDPDTVVVEPDVTIGADVEIHPGVSLLGTTEIGSACVLHAGSWVRDSRLEDEAVVGPYSVLDGALVGAGATVGPFARLRPGTELGRGARVGNFVEVKNARVGEGVKAGHLAYLGDAEIADGANIGAGTITCNYDGTKKHRTKIGKGAFIGSDTMLVAPVEVGDDAVTGAGSVITGDVPAGSLGVGRARQRNIANWSKRRRREENGD